ncbi:MAG TPA: sigma-70 family RNA polymerase sigma factor [Lacipirellula sp.]
MDDQLYDAPAAITQEEFMRLFSQHSRRIYQFILTLTINRADAEEIYQSTCVILWKKFAEYDPAGSFYAWACKMAQFECLQLRRRNRRLQAFSEDVLNLLAEQAMARVERIDARQNALADCLSKLKPRDAQLVDQRYYEERAPKDIARLQSISVHAVYRALARVHMSLRDCLTRALAQEHRS